MLAVIILVAGAVSSPLQPSLGNQWNHTVIDASGNVDLLSLCFDQWNLPHIAYDRGGEIWYAHRESGEWTWSTELVGTGTDPSIAVIPGGEPVVLYLSASNQLTLASKETAGWVYETYSDFDRMLSDPILAISQDGTKHMVYFNWMYGYRSELRYAWNEGSEWSRLEIESSYGEDVTSYTPDLTLSPGGYPRVSAIKIYIDDMDWDAYFLNLYSKQANGYWETETLASLSCRGRPGISASSDSVTAICYAWNDPDGLMYREYPEPSPTMVYVGDMYFPDLASDSQGNPHIVFLDGATLVYLSNEGVHPFPEFNNTWYSAEIEVDLYDQPHIAFNDDDNLNYIWFGDPTGIEGNDEFTGNLINAICPSPAVTNTLISFNPLHEGITSISVFDIAGRTVEQIQTEEHTVNLDVSAFPAGVYCIRAETDGIVDSELFSVMR